MLSSKEFPEPFFNRGGLIECRDATPLVRRLEKKLQGPGRSPVITLPEDCEVVQDTLVQEGYTQSDVMSVMVRTGHSLLRAATAVNIEPAPSDEQWSKAYLLSFYEELKLLPAVMKVVRRLRGVKSVSLSAAKIDGEAVGVLATYRTPGLAGVYCVGTLPRFRSRGIAGALLEYAHRDAESEGRTLFLQTLKSDGAEHFYAGRGFETRYRKLLMQKG
jgi:ribosomal protein S18 acetylase RimI-like enzyme